MANRFTDSFKWDDPWFRKLPVKYKCFWFFMLDKCTHAGIWKVDFEGASFHIGETVIEEECENVFNGRIYKHKEKWFIPKFIFFQYGILSEINKVHNSVINILKKEGLYKVYTKTLARVKEQAKEKDKDKEKEKDKIKVAEAVRMTKEEVQKLIDRFGEDVIKSYVYKLNNHKLSKGVKYQSDYRTILMWLDRAGIVGN